MPGFRDGAHFYGPLFEYVFGEFQAGRFPLWNPYENIGQPFAANPTSLVFYPGIYLAYLGFWVGLTDSASAYAMFVAGHLLLALLTTYRLTRSLSCSRYAATLAALAYTLGGSVLFQWNNVPFLIGAAWFPEALRQIGRIVERGRFRYAVYLGVILSLMVLGGDPQSVFHAGICAGVFLLFSLNKHSIRSVALLLVAGVLAFVLAAVQILPALELGHLSDRTLPRHQDIIYCFSVPYWRLPEYFWPGFGGWQLPVNARWASAWRGEDGIWTPSLYMGLTTFLFATLACLYFRTEKIRCRPHLRRAVLSILILFLLGSLGKDFLVYPILLEIPGYDSFRYPGKLTSVSSLMLAILAAWGFDILDKNKEDSKHFILLYRVSIVLGCFFSICIILLIYTGHFCVPACSLFGPFVSNKAILGIVTTVFVVLFLYFAAEIFYRTGYFKPLVTILLFADLVFANAWLLTTQQNANDIPTNQGRAISRIDENEAAPPRVYRFPAWYPVTFEKRSSPDRLAETIRFERRSLHPRYPLPMKINLVRVRGTMMLEDYRRWIDAITRDIDLHGFDKAIDALEEIGVEYIVAPGDRDFSVERIDNDADDHAEISFWKLPHPKRREFLQYEPNRIVFDLSLDEAQTVVLTEQYYPGWKALIAGGEIPIRKVEPCFRAVDLPAGKHRVEMIYAPPWIKTGMIMSISGLLFVAAALFIAGRINRRAPRNPA